MEQFSCGGKGSVTKLYSITAKNVDTRTPQPVAQTYVNIFPERDEKYSSIFLSRPRYAPLSQVQLLRQSI